MYIETAPPVAIAKERQHDYGDVEVWAEDGDDVAEDYQPFPSPEIEPLGGYGEADLSGGAEFVFPPNWEGLREIGDDPDALQAWRDGEIEWLPTFDEVYDYIDGLVDEFDLDAHELFELAFGYSDEGA